MKNITRYIQPILYANSSVIIPGFGGFICVYKSSSIDHVQGLLHPPSNTITFSEHLKTDDGVLLSYLQEEMGISEVEAESLIGDFVQEAELALDKREIISLPKVGRIYRDYEGKIHFLQDNSNFNRESYGLKVVQYYPILRDKHTMEQEAPLPVSSVEKVKERVRPVLSSPSALVPLFGGMAMIFFGIGFFMLQKGNTKRIADKFKIPVAQKHLNQRPTTKSTVTMSVFDSEDGNISEEERGRRVTQIGRVQDSELDSYTIDSEESEEIDNSTEVLIDRITRRPVVDEETKLLGTSLNKAVIVIGAYRHKDSVQKIVDRLIKNGFDVYQKRMKNGLIRVGAQFAYDGKADLLHKLKVIRENIEQKAWILEE